MLPAYLEIPLQLATVVPIELCSVGSINVCEVVKQDLRKTWRGWIISLCKPTSCYPHALLWPTEKRKQPLENAEETFRPIYRLKDESVMNDGSCSVVFPVSPVRSHQSWLVSPTTSRPAGHVVPSLLPSESPQPRRGTATEPNEPHTAEQTAAAGRRGVKFCRSNSWADIQHHTIMSAPVVIAGRWPADNREAVCWWWWVVSVFPRPPGKRCFNVTHS